MKEFSLLSQSGRSAQIGVKFVKFAIQTLWEGSGKACKGKKGIALQPKAVVHIDANILPEQILPQLGLAMSSKLRFNYTGTTPLDHPDEIELIEEMMEDALKLHQYLPVLYALGVEALLPKITPAQRAELADIMKTPKDKREGQVYQQYDNIYRACQDAITRHNLDVPPLFNCKEIDRTALIYFNRKTEVRVPRASELKDPESRLRLDARHTESLGLISNPATGLV